jgi:hypothetical protein
MARPLQLNGADAATERRQRGRPRIARSALTVACTVALMLCVAAAFAQPAGGFGGPNRGQWAEGPACAGGQAWGSLDAVTTSMTGRYWLSSRTNCGPLLVVRRAPPFSTMAVARSGCDVNR